MSTPQTTPALSPREFIPLMAAMMSLVALSIDTMLPALSAMGTDLQVSDPNATQMVISAIFLGMALGLPTYGTLSDSLGRKPVVYLGLVIYLAGCFVSWFAPTLSILLLGRVLQGFGVSGPRVVVMALVRDQYAGNNMARIMSFVMMIFILVPTVAPALGQGVMYVAHWRAIFATFILIGTAVVLWFALRQPETLPKARRKPLSRKTITMALGEIFRSRVALGYTIATGLISGAFLGFLNGIEPILKRQYGITDQFAAYFAACALFIGGASFVNSRLVMRLGMQRLSQTALAVLVLMAFAFWGYLLVYDLYPSLMVFMTYLVLTLFCMGIMFGNLNSLAMEPLGHIAGIGSSVVSALGTLLALPFSIYIGQQIDTTVVPVVAGFALLGTLTFALIRWVEARRPEAVTVAG